MFSQVYFNIRIGGKTCSMCVACVPVRNRYKRSRHRASESTLEQQAGEEGTADITPSNIRLHIWAFRANMHA